MRPGELDLLSRLAGRIPKHVPLQILPKTDWARQKPTYQQAEPAIIEAALKRALRRPSGNWYVVAASTDVRGDRPFGTTVAGLDIVAWRDEHGGVHAGPASCPHLGADLATGRVECGGLICPWHGLRLDGGREFGWKPIPVHDDGVLVWVRLDRTGGEEPSEKPILPARPVGHTLAAVTRLEGVCEPQDVISNRLDPWHGAWFHPYSFAQLEVLSAPAADAGDDADVFVVEVTFHIGRFGMPVIAEFTVPEPRTIVMHIVEGEGVGSVVETHATPIGPASDGRPRTAVIEAVIATSERPGFEYSMRAAPLIRPLMRFAATRLWRDDMIYAERRYTLRAKGNR